MNLDKVIEMYRNDVITGTFCDLLPVKKDDLPFIIKLRNQEKNKYYLNQPNDINLSQQEDWYIKYQKRTDDIYWGIWNKEHTVMVGTLRLYNIKDDSCEEGSCIIDEQYSMQAPYALEAKYLVGVFAFDILHVQQLINEIRTDNKVMSSLAKRQGYKKIKQTEIREVIFDYWLLDAEDFKRKDLMKILDYWKNR